MAPGSRRYPHAPIRPSRPVGRIWRGFPAAPMPMLLGVDYWPLTPADARTATDPLRGGSQRVREAWEGGNEPGPNDGGTRPAAPGFTGSTLHQTTCIMQGASLLRLWIRPRRPTGGSAAGPRLSTSWPFERCKHPVSSRWVGERRAASSWRGRLRAKPPVAGVSTPRPTGPAHGGKAR